MTKFYLRPGDGRKTRTGIEAVGSEPKKDGFVWGRDSDASVAVCLPRVAVARPTS